MKYVHNGYEVYCSIQKYTIFKLNKKRITKSNALKCRKIGKLKKLKNKQSEFKEENIALINQKQDKCSMNRIKNMLHQKITKCQEKL